MTKFLTFYNLCAIHDTKEFLGLSKDREEGNIITTLGRNIIIIIKVTTQNQVRSWTVLDKLTTKVVYDQKSKQYVGVFANRYIRCWSDNTEDINKLKKIKFQKSIADLVSNDDNETLILYGDGTSESLSSGIQSRKVQQPAGINKDESIPEIWDAKLFTSSNGQKMLTYFIKEHATQITQLVTVSLENDTLKPLDDLKTYKLDRREQNVNLAGHTVVDGEQNPFLLTIWSDKRIFVMSLQEDSSSNGAPGTFISMMDIMNVEQPISILGISKNCVAIYGSNSSQEGSSLVLYNTKFKVVNAKQFFKIYFDISRLWVVGNRILLAMGQNLSVVSYHVSKELLSEMVGSQISNNLQPYVGKEFINEDEELEGVIELNQFSTANSTKLSIPIAYNGSSEKADGKHTPYQPYEAFQTHFTRICNRNTEVNVLSSDKENDFRIDLLENYNKTNFTTEEIELLAKELEKCGASDKEVSEKILTILLRTNLSSDIITCIRRYSNISQKMLAKTLKYALKDLAINESNSAHNRPDENNFELNNKEYDQPMATILLNSVLSCSIDIETISTHIRKELDFQLTLFLIEHLYSLFTRNDVSLEERLETCLDFNEDLQLLHWLSVLFSAHFQELTLSRNEKLINILTKWKEVLSLYKTDLIELQSVSSILYNLVNGKCSGGNKYSKWYSIEEVMLF